MDTKTCSKTGTPKEADVRPLLVGDLASWQWGLASEAFQWDLDMDSKWTRMGQLGRTPKKQ